MRHATVGRRFLAGSAIELPELAPDFAVEGTATLDDIKSS